MSDIKYMEKPDWVSWEDVIACMRAANEVNYKKGYHMSFSDVTPEKFQEFLKDGKCFVALNGNEVIGTASYSIRNLKKWYRWGKVIYYSYDGIRPEYRGTDVYFELYNLREKYIKETGIEVYQFHTAINNKMVIRINLKYGYKFVLFRPNPKGHDYYSVTMLKWDKGSPFPNWYLRFMFNLSKFVTLTFFTTEFVFNPNLKRYLDYKGW